MPFSILRTAESTRQRLQEIGRASKVAKKTDVSSNSLSNNSSSNHQRKLCVLPNPNDNPFDRAGHLAHCSCFARGSVEPSAMQ
mmetsp:Transcript_59105/g.117084  ORF Transcript_59105/g.117084 Transcript_59105/m.117084 type:complete len:83 (-) Transcript_59105:2161-2409(-)